MKPSFYRVTSFDDFGDAKTPEEHHWIPHAESRWITNGTTLWREGVPLPTRAGRWNPALTRDLQPVDIAWIFQAAAQAPAEEVALGEAQDGLVAVGPCRIPAHYAQALQGFELRCMLASGKLVRSVLAYDSHGLAAVVPVMRAE